MKKPKQETMDLFASKLAEALGKGLSAEDVGKIGLTAVYYPVWSESLDNDIVPPVENIKNYIINSGIETKKLIDICHKEDKSVTTLVMPEQNSSIVELNVISEIKVFVWVNYGIRLYTGITNAYGHYQPFECVGYDKDGEKIDLSSTGEDPINRNEVAVLKEAKEYIINTYSVLKCPMISFN